MLAEMYLLPQNVSTEYHHKLTSSGLHEPVKRATLRTMVVGEIPAEATLPFNTILRWTAPELIDDVNTYADKASAACS